MTPANGTKVEADTQTAKGSTQRREALKKDPNVAYKDDMAIVYGTGESFLEEGKSYEVHKIQAEKLVAKGAASYDEVDVPNEKKKSTAQIKRDKEAEEKTKGNRSAA